MQIIILLRFATIVNILKHPKGHEWVGDKNEKPTDAIKLIDNSDSIQFSFVFVSLFMYVVKYNI
jgi:hypothetical protein